jgi:DNA-directed RNA polymerase specialized sigma24 family protein
MRADFSDHQSRAAFRDLHGPRLHGFALLLTLGDASKAASLASDALYDADSMVAELRHPERAAAWLRARLTRAARTDARRLVTHRRLEALQVLGVGETALAGLARLSRLERAAVIASTIEQMDRRDVATIVGRRGSRLEKLLHQARRHYLEGAAAAPIAPGGPPGPIRRQIATSAARTMT